MRQTMTSDDPERLRRALELRGLGESPIPAASKGELRDWYQHGNNEDARRVIAILTQTGPARVRVGARLIDFDVSGGVISARWNRTDREAQGGLGYFDDGPFGVTQVEKPIGPPPSVQSSRVVLDEGRRDSQIQQLRERLDALERASR